MTLAGVLVATETQAVVTEVNLVVVGAGVVANAGRH